MGTASMEGLGDVLRRCRESAGLTQSDLAARGGTSSATLSLYENGHKEPRVTTLTRLVEAAGFELAIELRPVSATIRPMSRPERRSLELHRRIAERLLSEPDEVIGRARSNCALLRSRHADGRANRWLREWSEILHGRPEDIALHLTDPGEKGRDLRQNTPFAGVLDPIERWAVYREFAA